MKKREIIYFIFISLLIINVKSYNIFGSEFKTTVISTSVTVRARASQTNQIPETEIQLGHFYVGPGAALDPQASWVFASKPDYTTSRKDVKVILNWYSLDVPWGDGGNGASANEIQTAEELNSIENQLRNIPIQNFWGTLWFGSEEHRLTHFDNFNDDVDTMWFNERIVGYPIYLKEAPGASRDMWAEEMMLRLMRGACNYWHSKGLKVGVMMGGGTLVDNFRGKSHYDGPASAWGLPAYNYWRNNFDFVVMYPFTCTLEYYQLWTVQYWEVVERDLTKQIKFLIPPQSWSWWNGPDASDPRWIFEEEAVALELKWAFDHGYIITPYYRGGYWDYAVKGMELYLQNKPYYEEYVSGENLLTHKKGLVYGWVKLT